MSTVTRSVLGNLLVGGILLATALALLQLHLAEPWWIAAPRPLRLRWAAGAIAVYAACCALLWWRGRPRSAPVRAEGEVPLLVVWASQTGFARLLAERTAEALEAAGHTPLVRSVDQVDSALLERSRTVLCVVSTTGEGDAPDHALPFLRRVMGRTADLHRVQYGVLALGDHTYDHYCAFGRDLDAWLRTHGAHPLFDRVDVDNADPAALRHWQQLLGQLGGTPTELPDWSPAQYASWILQRRSLENAGSQGAAVHRITLVPADGTASAWQAGDIAEIGPRHSELEVTQWLDAHGMDGNAADHDGIALRERLAGSHLPEDTTGMELPALFEVLQPLPHREYSIASIPAEGHLQLLLRRQLRPDGRPGLGSGWLCDHACIGGTIDLRVRSNPNFHTPPRDAPLLLIGNGTGIAGLRAHLRQRIASGARRNWLLFGERSAHRDFFFGDDLSRWQEDGWLEQLDAVFSRDGGEHRYVQHRLHARRDMLMRWLSDGASILVCGSLQGMAPAVDAVIEQVLGQDGKEQLILQGRYRRDVY